MDGRTGDLDRLDRHHVKSPKPCASLDAGDSQSIDHRSDSSPDSLPPPTPIIAYRVSSASDPAEADPPGPGSSYISVLRFAVCADGLMTSDGQDGPNTSWLQTDERRRAH
ncbi:hypothetical protein CCHR01_00754 [Colletotrichum chrysophilum]|uniref:Uncharacterized protein n=1 Tax=Colletotrichum chrysophilum TaxID=1836956 RepID=A0AAD9EPS9_9PEZI|nr:hypothetical protein CCHR01_00754 [Colletotrichum chrysophilum]